MIKNLHLREPVLTDWTALEALYEDAFPGDNLWPLVTALHGEGDTVVSIAAVVEKRLVGHILLTHCRIPGQQDKVALLGPLAVAPTVQKQGVGNRLVQESIWRMEQGDVALVLVLGDPAYYRRFGFTPENHVTPPYDLPPEWSGAWQSLYLGAKVNRRPRGKLSVPPPWRYAALWQP
jgi:putative acetyltransferase